MDLNMVEAAEKFSAEDASLNERMAAEENKVNTLSTFSFQDYGLKGDAYQALEDSIRIRVDIARACFVCYEAAAGANAAHANWVAGLPRNTGTGWSQQVWEEELARQTALLNQAKEDAKKTVVAFYREELPPSLKSLSEYESEIQGYQANIDELNQQKEAIDEYAEGSLGIYDNSVAQFNSVGIPAANAAQLYSSTGTWPSKQDWRFGLDGKYKEVLVYHKVEIAKLYLSGEELEAYVRALGPDGVITSEEIYRITEENAPDDGETFRSLNENLITALAKMPTNCVSKKDVLAFCEAYERMGGYGGYGTIDIEAIERVFELCMLDTGRDMHTSITGERVVTPSGKETFSEYELSPIYLRMAEVLGERFTKLEFDDFFGKKSAYYQAAALCATTTDLALKYSGKPVYSVNDSGFEAQFYAKSIGTDNPLGHKAFMISVDVNSDIRNRALDLEGPLADLSLKSIYNHHVYVATDGSDSANIAIDLASMPDVFEYSKDFITEQGWFEFCLGEVMGMQKHMDSVMLGYGVCSTAKEIEEDIEAIEADEDVQARIRGLNKLSSGFSRSSSLKNTLVTYSASFNGVDEIDQRRINYCEPSVNVNMTPSQEAQWSEELKGWQSERGSQEKGVTPEKMRDYLEESLRTQADAFSKHEVEDFFDWMDRDDADGAGTE